MYNFVIHSNTTISGVDFTKVNPSVSCFLYGGSAIDTIFGGNYIYTSACYLSNVVFSGTPYRVNVANVDAHDITLANGNVYLESGLLSNVHISAWTQAFSNVHIESADCIAYVNFYGGIINNVNVSDGGNIHMSANATISNAVVSGGAAILCHSGATVVNASLYAAGDIYVYESGVVSNVTVNESGYLYVYS